MSFSWLWIVPKRPLQVDDEGGINRELLDHRSLALLLARAPRPVAYPKLRCPARGWAHSRIAFLPGLRQPGVDRTSTNDEEDTAHLERPAILSRAFGTPPPAPVNPISSERDFEN